MLVTFLLLLLFSLAFMLRLLLLVLRLLVLHLLMLLVLHLLMLLVLHLLMLLRVLFVLLQLVPFKGGLVTRTWFASPGAGYSSGAAFESFLPPTALAAMVLLIEFPAITLALPVLMPIRIPPPKTLPVLRPHLIPRKPSRTIPGSGSDNIAGSISVIWGPTVFRAEKVVQDAIQKPITVVIDPRRIRPHPG